MHRLRCLFHCLLPLCLSLGLTNCRKPPAPPVKLTHGAELYGRMCAVCHGEQGQGYKADQAPRLAGPEFQATVSDAALREAIKNGRMGTTMSAWSKERGGLNFKNANLEGTNLKGADLSDARNLTREQLAKAIIDETTTLPAYLRS